MSASNLKIECADDLGVLISKPKRLKILVGGRGSTKSTFVADYVLSQVQAGQRWCCSREYQNSIDDSVHSLLIDEIERCQFAGFNVLKTEITHNSGGKAFYRGLARNITSLKGINANGLWIEEGESLSSQTLKVLTASIRISAKDAQAAQDGGYELPDPEIWVTMNRGSSADPIAKKFLARAEKDLLKHGYYEDDMMMVIQINYPQNPWFHLSGLEQERLDDEKHMAPAEYRSKWHGEYYDSVENAIIPVEWFNAAIDAHVKLGFKPRGLKIVSHDPSDEGDDSKGLIYRHGSVILHAEDRDFGDVNEGCDWATDYALSVNADLFVWDCDGLGIGLRRQIAETLNGKHTEYEIFKGSEGVDDPDEVYHGDGIVTKGDSRTNRQTFKNKRAQYYFYLADRFYNTWRAVTKHEYIDPDEMISISSGIECIDQLRSEICRVPKKRNNNGLKQIMSKDEMLRLHHIESPNIGDSLMMSGVVPIMHNEHTQIDFESEF